MSDRYDIRKVNIKDLIEPVTKWDYVKSVYLFGSRAYKYQTRSLRSDIDILIYSDKPIPEDDFMKLRQLEKALDVFYTIDNQNAISMVNGSCLNRDDLIKALEARRLWDRDNGFDEAEINKYKDMSLIDGYDYKMSRFPSYTGDQEKFFEEYGLGCVFVIMPFAKRYNKLYEVLKKVFKKRGFKAVRADEHTFHADLWENVNVYLDCCVAAVAFFEKKLCGSFNPNVALEVGYMLGRAKKVLIIKDRRIKDLPTDMKGKICYDYDRFENNETLEKNLEDWIRDNL